MKIVIDPLYLRRPKLNYISPAVCEGIFSGTGSPIIILDDISRGLGPTGLVIGGRGQFRLSWNVYPGALCYNVYSLVLTETQLSFPCTDVQAISQTGTYQILFECLVSPTVILPQAGCYRISAITGDGETDLSDPICTCECPECSCPPGTEFYPEFNDCLCSQQPCPDGEVWDPTLCLCVPCGSQQCAPGFMPDPANPCACIPGGGGLVTVCNEERTATCPQGGDPVVIPAGTFCVQVPPANVAAAQNQMNSQAQAQAESELECGWRICDWVAIRDIDLLVGIIDAACTFSALPEWDGVFDKSAVGFINPADKIKYFIGQAIFDGAVSPSESPSYPDGNWQDLCYTRIFYSDSQGKWTLSIGCLYNCVGNQTVWVGELVNGDPLSPAGIYTRTDGLSLEPETMEVASSVEGSHCTGCQDWAQSIQETVWTQGPFGSPPPCGVFEIVAGSGTWEVTNNTTTCQNSDFIEITGEVCNPNEDAYDLTVEIPWEGNGNVSATPPHIVQFQAHLDNALVAFDTKDLLTGPFTPGLLVFPLPSGRHTIKLVVTMACLPTPSVTLNSTGPLTIAPLTPP